MSKTQGLWLCSLLLAVLLFFCVARHAPVIETDLSERSRSVLDADNMAWANIILDGRDLTLTGVAPTAELRDSAGELAGAVWGVRSVNNELEVYSEGAGKQIQPLAKIGRKAGALTVSLKDHKS